ncbi:MAG: tetraacyldisaccharide 4'-kinase [Alphaproteobacteria bacterium]|nr:MAG: tetraacyldisaccharide 4'-kinase [Alphaproteobacteria bacterium]
MRTPKFWYRRRGGANLWSTVLAPLGYVYAGATAVKQNLIKPLDVGVPVVCLGNLTVGGTGKTPLALVLAPILKDLGFKPAFLTRGYGGQTLGPHIVDLVSDSAELVGDEPLLLAEVAPTVVATDRVAGAKAAIREGADLIIMDDGFQNPSLAKTLSFVVIDQGRGFGNGLPIPAGPLREAPAKGLARADAILLTGSTSDRTPDLLYGLKEKGLPTFRTHLDVGAITPALPEGSRAVVAFSGLGDPQKFFDTALDLGLTLIDTEAFPDHHPYSEEDIARLKRLSEQYGAPLLTTAKDAVRLPTEFRAQVHVLPVAPVFEEREAFLAFLQEKLVR